MGTRRQARELAMQALFYMDMQNNVSNGMLEHFCSNFSPPPKSQAFFMKLVTGVLEARDELDALIEQFSKNWDIHRMSCVDRNVMRIAAFELLYCDDIPPKVTINEAVDVGKKFGTEDSGAFINGIMDSIRGELEAQGRLEAGLVE
jgi:transcription antitermination protein NusB